MMIALLLLAGQPADPNPCDLHGQRNMLRCVVAKRLAAEADLATLVTRAEREMRTRDAGDPKGGHLALFRTGQAAWTRYRDSWCELEGFNMRGGSGQPFIANACLERMDRARIDELKPAIGR